VLRNLLSNAVKFTSAGEVTLAIRGSAEKHFTTPPLTVADRVVAFEITDTGIGIPPEQLRTIFEAFQQADGTISRKFGGTGLGLSISREIARLIGGEIHVESEPGRGSRFTLYLPVHVESGVKGLPAPPASEAAASAPVASRAPREPREPREPVPERVADDDGDISPGDRVLLVALPDPELCRAAVDVARDHGFKVLATPHADRALTVARERHPDGMVVGMDMATHDGTSLLQRLKRIPETRRIPTVATHSPGAAESVHQGRLAGALEVIEVPFTRTRVDAALEHLESFVDRSKRSLLVVTDDVGGDAASLAERFAALDEVEVEVVGTAQEALTAFTGRSYDGVVIDLRLAGGGGFDLLRRIRARRTMRHTPVVVSGSDGLSRREESRLSQYAEVLTVTRPRSLPEMVDQTAVFLHCSELEPPEGRDVVAGPAGDREQVVLGTRILIVDDDVRNVFALTSALEQHGITVLYAENGEAGLQTLRREPEIDLVLMDVMMPGMDGYTAMREIRSMPAFRDLPVIALTAKAMPGDRDNSLTAGASDYVTKPVDVEQLLSVIRSWLS
jgi:CheY-like chemotaxis protein